MVGYSIGRTPLEPINKDDEFSFDVVGHMEFFVQF
jgi:hypothetical protein